MMKKQEHVSCVGTNGGDGPSDGSTAMKSIRLSEVPEYLKEGQLFKSFNIDDCGEISVPRDALKLDDSVENTGDVIYLLSTLRYWLIGAIPYPIIKYALEQGCPTTLVAEFQLQFPILTSLQAIYAVPSEQRMLMAFTLGESEIIRYLHEQGYAMEPECAMTCALHGHSDCLQFYVDRTHTVPESLMAVRDSAAKHGHVQCLQIAHNAGSLVSGETAAIAVEHNMVGSLKFCCENGIIPTGSYYTLAAEQRSMDCMKYLHETVGCEWITSACTMAAHCGHLDCLAYAHEHGCPWNHKVAAIATMNGHLGCLQYIHEHGGVLNDLVTSAAVTYNHVGCLCYALDHGCPIHPNLVTLAAFQGQLECLQCLHEHGCEWNVSTTMAAVDGGHLECLQYAVQHGCEVSQLVLETARAHQMVRCVEYLESVM